MMKLLVAIFLISLCPAALAQSNIQIDSLLQYLSAQNGFSGSVEISKGNKVVYKGDYNFLSNGTLRYRIGSVSKVYTAIMVYQLIDEGKLTIDDTLDRFFPTIKYASEITIGHLLSHTSGIFSVTDWKGYFGSRTKEFTREDIVSIINDHKPEFKPGRDCLYSNSNYILLGFIIEDITQKRFHENLTERISRPFALPNTYCEYENIGSSSRERSYKFDGENWNPDVDSDPSLPFAAGAIVSTPGEMRQMMYHLFNSNIVSATALSSMKSLKSRAIGHGLFKAPFYDKIGWGHTGRIDEFRSFVGYFPEDSITLAICTNGATVKLNDVIVGVLSLYFGRRYNFPEFVHTAVDTPSVAYFEGKYKAKLLRFITVATFHITSAGKNHLFMSEHNDGLPSDKALLIRTGAFTFFSNEAGGGLEFFSKNEAVKGVKLRQGTFTIRCKKVKK